jgi:hypothetical protein
MKKLLLFLFLLSLFNVGKSQMCNTTSTNMGLLTMTGVWQNATGTSGAKRYWTFNATAGCTYDFSTCNSLFTNDTYLRLYSGTNPLTAILQTSNDDNGPFCASTKASISWVCPTTGAYSILVTNWSCANLSASTILSYRQTCSPPYNPCTTIPTINCGITNNLTVASGNGIYNPPTTSCGFSTPGKEYIYSFTPTVTGNYVISQPTSFGYIDWFYKVASGGCNGTGWTCIDDITNANIGNANVNINLTAGTTYYIMADPESTVGGNVVWTLNCPTPPVANDNCGNAISITTLPYTSPVTSNNPSTDDVPTSTTSCGTQGSNVWYTVVGNGNQLTASTCDASSNFDTEVRIYTGSCSALNSMVEIVCNDDDATCASSNLRSTASWCSNPGVTYYISVGYYASGAGYGNFVLSVTDGTPCVVLPIELVEFGGLNYNDYNDIFWVTATELNNNYFTLERSTDGFTWSVIKTQEGSGTSSTPHFYEYKDYGFTKGKINYYRLSQTDFNGQKEYFNIIAVESKQEVKCDEYKYYSILGDEIDIKNVSPGLYLRKCGDYTEKIIKLGN